jgi:16S rRNA pseudouridine516 synthase
VHGVVLKEVASPVPHTASVSLDGELVCFPKPRYLMLHKPIGVVSATHDPTHRTVMDLLDDVVTEHLHIAGRLDIDSSGLVLLTDDGQWSHRITAPSKKCHKTYRVGLVAAINEKDLERIRAGVLLHHERKPTLPARVQRLSDGQLRLTIMEGKYHQVKRMFAAVGNRVISLHRESIGELKLDKGLEPGTYRSLQAREILLF